MKVQFAQVTDDYLKQLKQRKKEVKAVVRRSEELTRLRTNETGTFRGDVQTLRNRVTQYEKHIKRLKQLVDKEDTVALIKELQSAAAGDLPDLDQIIEELAQVDQQVAHSRRIRI